MKIGGFLPQSLIDYPEKIAAVVFTQGCNFRCGYCHNPELVLPQLFTHTVCEKEVLQSIRERAGWLDAVVITGGEPTIHNDLPYFLEQLKKNNLSVKLDTNGTHPEMLKLIIDKQLVDYVAMDIKNVLTTTAYGQVIGLSNCKKLLKKVEKTINILTKSTLKVEFRTTKIPEIHTLAALEEIKRIAKEHLLTINNFREGVTVSSF